MKTPFVKMNGSGNDFVIFDARENPLVLKPEQIREIASRNNATTQGCDQLIVLEKSQKADVFMRIFNADGGQVNACGNATRCVAGIIEFELQKLPISIETNAGILHGVQKAYTEENHEYILVDMGEPTRHANEIPLALPIEEASKRIEQETGLAHAHFVSMGSPHVVFFLRFEPGSDKARDDAPLFALEFEKIGQSLEKNREIFPEGVNVSIALLRAASDGLGHIINARVWERGAGLTEACGTAACAMMEVAHRRDSSITRAHIFFEPFGTVVTTQVEPNGHILLGGRIEKEFEGAIAL